MTGAAKNTIPAISALLNNKTADGRIENITVNKKQKEKTVMKKDYVHLCVVLDASGSMARIKDGIKSSINAFMAEAMQMRLILTERFSLWHSLRMLKSAI